MIKSNETKAQWQAEGKCYDCGDEPEAGKKRCRPCLGKNRDYAKVRSKRLRDNGLCRMCGSKPATEQDLCNECLLKAKKSSKVWRERAKIKGQCIACGGLSVGGTTRCQECLERVRAYSKRHHREAAAKGNCRNCYGAPRVKDCGTGEYISQYCHLCHLKRLARGMLGSANKFPVLLDKLYRSDWRCKYTGRKLEVGKNLSFDHVLPVKRFPERKFDSDNLVPADVRVNFCKRDLTGDEFLAMAKEIATWPSQ